MATKLNNVYDLNILDGDQQQEFYEEQIVQIMLEDPPHLPVIEEPKISFIPSTYDLVAQWRQYVQPGKPESEPPVGPEAVTVFSAPEPSPPHLDAEVIPSGSTAVGGSKHKERLLERFDEDEMELDMAPKTFTPPSSQPQIQYIYVYDSDESQPDEPIHLKPAPITPRPVKPKPVEKPPIENDWQVSTTPLVGQTAQPHFLQTFKIVGDKLPPVPFDVLASRLSAQQLLDIRKKKRRAKWGPPLELDASRYQWVTLGGRTFAPSDIVYTAVGEDDLQARKDKADEESARSINEIANQMWFAEIVYLHEDDSTQEKMAHVRWFLHGSKSMLREVANPHEVFLLNECHDIPLKAILSDCEMERLPLHQEDDREYFSNLEHNQFYYRFLYLPDKAATISVEPHVNTQEHFDFGQCFNCINTANQELARTPQLIEGGRTILFKNIHFHIGDFVFLEPQDEEPPALFDLCQIIKIESSEASSEPHVVVQVLKHSTPIEDNAFNDNRCIFYSNKFKSYGADQLCRKFFAKPLTGFLDEEQVERWLTMPDHFYIGAGITGRVPACKECSGANEDERRSIQSKLHAHPLSALDIFSGCGGFSLGLDLAGFIKTKWAIELESIAAATLSNNCPDIEVFNQDVNQMLEHTVLQHRRHGKLLPMRDILGNDMAEMPSPGDVDFIYGGPPCQSFSYMNSSKRDDDPRHGLTLALLGFVEHYRPKFVMIENVRGMTGYKLVGRNKPDGVKMGVVKVIMAVLHSLGYQVHINVLQAGSYGAPQSRRRLIVLASLRDCPLPQFPLPTHSFSSTDFSLDLTDGLKMDPLTQGYAALHPVTVNEAISDLPSFDWKDPKDPQSLGEDHAAQHGLHQILFYPSEPLNQYQKWVRNGSSRRVRQHYTKVLTTDVAERVVHVPMRAGANYEDLPIKYRTAGFTKSYRSAYRRIDGDQCFPTVTANFNPHSKYGECLHPSQKRVITIRELARSQGFPDSFIFEGDRFEDISRQIGNAVAIPLGIALGREVGKAAALRLAVSDGNNNSDEEMEMEMKDEMWEVDIKDDDSIEIMETW